MTARSISRRQWMLFAGFVVAYFAWLGASTLWSASADARLVAVFETDEFEHIVAIREALTHGTFAINWSIYGHFFFNLALGPLLAWNLVQTPGDQAIIVTLRFVSLASAAAAVLWAFALTARYWGVATGWAAGVALALLPATFNHWAITSHPDTLQVAGTMMALYAACRYGERGEIRWLDVAAVGAGFAFSAKYGGVLLIPCLALLALVVTRRQAAPAVPSERTWIPVVWVLLGTGAAGVIVSLTLRQPYLGARRISAQDLQLALSAGLLLLGIGAMLGRRALARIYLPPVLRLWVRIASLFWIAFIATSPFLLNRMTFVFAMLHDSRVIGFGQFFAAGGHWSDWFRMMAAPTAVGPACFAAACAACLLFVNAVAREKLSALARPDGVLLLWILTATAMLVSRVKLREERYLLIVIPPLLIVAVAAVARAVTFVAARQRLAGALLLAAAVAWGAWEATLALRRQNAVIHDLQTREFRSETVEAGRLLTLHATPSDRILYDFYSYVPPAFERAKPSWGMTADEMQAFRPDVIVVHDQIRRRFAALEDAPRFYEASAFLARFHFYEALEQGRNGFALVDGRGPARIYRRVE